MTTELDRVPPTDAPLPRGSWLRSAIRVALLPLMAVIVVAVAVSGSKESYGIERTFAGSAQLDYLFVPTENIARGNTFDGFTTELSLKLAVDFSDNVSVHVKTCYGCHGFEMGMAFADLRVADPFIIRVGRFSPSFGDFPIRHDPANHRTSDKPLPYDMGRALRFRDWGISILPAPYVDNGLEVRGVLHVGDMLDIDYAAYVVGGLRGNNDATDVDFLQSRSPAFYYVDNNSRPAVGGRLAFSFQLGDVGSLTLGASAMYGTYDPQNELEYFVLGGDLVLRIKRWTLRAEYIVRRTEMSLGDNPEERFRYGPGEDGKLDDFFTRHGFYVETDVPVGAGFELVGRYDGLLHFGNVTVSSPLRSKSAVFRYTLGVNYVFLRQLRIKLSGEFYDFSDFDDEAAIHLGFVGAF